MTELTTLLHLRTALHSHVELVLDAVDEGEYEESKHDVGILIGGRLFELPFHADTYENLVGFVEQQIKDAESEQ